MKRPCGFTLIELMLVVAVLSIVAVVAVPAFIKYKQREREWNNPPLNMVAVSQAIENLGYIEIKMETCSKDTSSQGCHSHDSFACQFTAMNPRNQAVDLIACVYLHGSADAPERQQPSVSVRSR